MTVAPPESDPPPSQWELLALAYTDGELSPSERLNVEQRAAVDSEYAELLNDLSQTGPNNRELWTAENPSESQWSDRKRKLLRALMRKTPAKSGRFRWGILGWTLAACVVWTAISYFVYLICFCSLPTGALVSSSPSDSDLLSEYDVLPIASPEDVMISSVRGSGEVRFVSCKHPLPDSPNWAKVQDVEIKSGPTVAAMSNTTAGEMPIYNLDPADR